MNFLYADNYRGFSKTLLPLKKVNFLVGENSTGKTSILALVSFLSEREFWFEHKFNSENFELGTYDDIVTENTKSSNFRIGFISIGNTLKSSKMFLFSYVEDRGLPKLIQCNYVQNSEEAYLEFKKKTVKADYRNIKQRGELEDFLLKLFKNWTKAKLHTNDISSTPANLKNATNVPLPILLDMLFDSPSRKKPKSSKGLYSGLNPLYPRVFCSAPIRSEPKRTYDALTRKFTSQGTHAAYALRDLLRTKKTRIAVSRYLVKYGKNSNLFDGLTIRNLSGSYPASPFALEVKLAKKILNIKNVGYGVSQCFPLLVDYFAAGYNSWFATQQPEIHLHPKAQAALGDLFFQIASSTQKHFFIETHSDYTIDRFRLNYRKRSKKLDSQVIFFKRTPFGNRAYTIEILANGEYSSKQPKEFRTFFIKEEMNLLDLR